MKRFCLDKKKNLIKFSGKALLPSLLFYYVEMHIFSHPMFNRKLKISYRKSILCENKRKELYKICFSATKIFFPIEVFMIRLLQKRTKV